MKIIINILFVFGTVSLTSQETIKDRYLQKLHNGDFEIPRELENTTFPNLTDAGGQIIAVIDKYSDQVIAQIQKLLMRSGLDPVELPSETLKLLPWGKITLSNGWLQNLSTLSRNTDVKVIYRSSEKTVELQIPVKFDALVFTYDYTTKVFPITIKGGVEGKLKDVKINIILSFNFRGYKARLDKFDIRDSGKISIRFTGNALVDWITNAMTSVVTLFLKPIILNIVDWVLKDSLDSAVDVVNKVIDCVLHPSACQL